MSGSLISTRARFERGELGVVLLASMRDQDLPGEAERDRVVAFGMEGQDGIDLVEHPVPVAGAARVLRQVAERRDLEGAADPGAVRGSTP